MPIYDEFGNIIGWDTTGTGAGSAGGFTGYDTTPTLDPYASMYTGNNIGSIDPNTYGQAVYDPQTGEFMGYSYSGTPSNVDVQAMGLTAGSYTDASGNTFTVDAGGNVSYPFDFGSLAKAAGGYGNLGATALSSLGSYLQGKQAIAGAQNAMGTLQSNQVKQEAALAPYIVGGVGAWNKLQGMSTTPTQTFSYDPSKYYQSPVYQSLYGQMKDATMAQGAMTGNIGSGNLDTALMQGAAQIGAQYMPLDQQIQQQNYANYLAANQQDYARQANLASTGLNALGYQTTLGTNTAQLVGGLQNQVGTNANTLQNTLQPWANTLANSKLYGGQ